MAWNEIKSYPVAENEIPLKQKYLRRKPGNVGLKKTGNGGGVGRKARALKRSSVVSQRNSPTQWGRHKQLVTSNNEPYFH